VDNSHLLLGRFGDVWSKRLKISTCKGFKNSTHMRSLCTWKETIPGVSKCKGIGISHQCGYTKIAKTSLDSLES
jgi:hypothetical protein